MTTRVQVKTTTSSGSNQESEWDVTALRGGGVLAALGTNQGTAAPIVNAWTLVTGADGTVGVILPANTTDSTWPVFLKNDDAANAVLKVYPPTGGTINANRNL